MTEYSYNEVLTNTLFQDKLKSYTLHVIAPASATAPEKIEQLRTLPGFNIRIPKNIMNQDICFHACGDQERFELLKEALYHEDQQTILWTLRGGYGSARLIDSLLSLPPPKYEKIFIGFSDNTALHLFFSQQWHWKTIHGSGISQLLDPHQDPNNYLSIANIIPRTPHTVLLNHLIPFNQAAHQTNPIQGCLTGGNLTLVESSIGTPWQIQTAEKIVFFEDIGEKGYRIDRSFHHLRQAGLFDDVKAFLLGEFIHPTEADNIFIALNRFAQETNIPVYKTQQFGHGISNYPLVYNTPAIIQPNESQRYTLEIS